MAKGQVRSPAIGRKKSVDKGQILPEIMKLRSAGVSFGEIAKRYNKSSSTIHRWYMTKLEEDFNIGHDEALRTMQLRISDHYRSMRSLMAMLQDEVMGQRKSNSIDIDGITKLVGSIARLNSEGIKLLSLQADLLGLKAAKRLEIEVTLIDKLQEVCKQADIDTGDVLNGLIIDIEEAMSEQERQQRQLASGE